MGAKIMFQNPPPMAEMVARLQKVGINLGGPQKAFLDKHATHRGLIIDNNKVFCRTCNASANAH